MAAFPPAVNSPYPFIHQVERGAVREKWLALDHNSVPDPGLESGQLDPKSSALIIRTFASHKTAHFFRPLSCQIDLWNNSFAFLSARWQSRTCKSATNPFTPVQRIRLLRKLFSVLGFTSSLQTFVPHAPLIPHPFGWIQVRTLVLLWDVCACLYIQLACALCPSSVVYIYLVLISIFTFLVSNYAHFVGDSALNFLRLVQNLTNCVISHILARHPTEERFRQLDITGTTIVRVLSP